jgi:hypothetical protein
MDCWVQCQNEDFKSYLNAPEDANPPTRIVTSRRAISVIYDLFGGRGVSNKLRLAQDSE